LKKKNKNKTLLLLSAPFFVFLHNVLFTKTETTLRGSQYKSQYGQDQFVNEKFFHNKKNGFFVDIGAHDGITLSNTYFFEKKLSWNGICIEPIPNVFSQLRNNRGCICIQGAISTTNQPAEFLKISGYSEMLSGLIDKYDPRHINRIDKELNAYGGNSETIQVQCYKLNDLLDINNIQYIDYLSIDTEGGEFDILQTIDFDRFNISVIDVENNYNDDRIRVFLEGKGYKFITRIKCDEIYSKNL
jgi:FkbM family methyltransferase